jgi:hypothetical protein
VADRRADVLVGRLLQSLQEHRVREVLGDPDPLEERQVRLLQIAWLPARHVVVHGEDDGRIAGGLRTPDQAGGQLVVVRPVELVPARGVAIGLGDLFQRRRRGRAGDQWQADGRGGPGGSELPFVVQQGLHPDRREHDRRRHPRAEHLH